MPMERSAFGIAIALVVVACSSSDTPVEHADASPSDAAPPSEAAPEGGDAGAATDYAHLVIVGNDEKVSWDTMGRQLLGAPGADTVKFLDITDPLAPTFTASVPVQNSVTGPPTNVAIVRQHGLASSPMRGNGWRSTAEAGRRCLVRR